MSEVVDSATRIRSLHEQTLDRISQVLSEEIASEFVRIAKEAVFPRASLANQSQSPEIRRAIEDALRARERAIAPQE